jgi:adenylate cyclase
MQRNKIKAGKKQSDELLLNILPAETARELKKKGYTDAQLIEQTSVLFTDLKGFSALTEKVTPQELVHDLHECFSAFDHICEKYGIEKIKTIGDAYMAAGGVPVSNTTHAEDVINAALEMAEVVEKGKARRISAEIPIFEIRIGVHTGPVVAGIVGIKKFQYDIWGDTVNTASRMETSGEVGKVNISKATYALVKDKFICEDRGEVETKSKGKMQMYFVHGKKQD